MSEMLANQYCIAGRFDEAAAIYEALLRCHPDRADLRCKLDRCHDRSGRTGHGDDDAPSSGGGPHLREKGGGT
jgi:cytochrome c-type biogenesis protein CcmH/NrfG